MGSFTAVEVARRGFSVAGFDQFAPPHHRGSHSGGTRVYRIAYPEGSGYVGLAQRAGELWDQAAERLGTQLLHRIGMLYMGPPEENFLREIDESGRTNRLHLEKLSAGEIHRRYPAFEVPENYAGIFDPQAGWIDVDASITSSLAQAALLGVDSFFDRPVLGWKGSSSEVQVHLQDQVVTADRLIITAGAWAAKLMQDLALPLAIKRKVIGWFDPLTPELFAAGRIPVFTFPENSVYGFPTVPGLGVKIAEHDGGRYVTGADNDVPPAGPEDLNPLAAIAGKYMPKLAGAYPNSLSRLHHSVTCLYTMTPDENFYLDHHPRFRNVVFAAGFSGHGFKFAPLVAVVLADLALDGKTLLPIDFLSLRRPITTRA
jgi:monomeric sarcosine oxidase